MLTKIKLSASQTLVGVSVGGVYTSLCVPELDAVFDVGIAPRSFVGPRHLFLSHGHADHVGALPALLGVRGLARLPAPTTFVPAEIVDDLRDGIDAFNRGQHRPMQVPFVALSPGDERPLYGDLHVRAFRTIHSVPSLGYQLFRKVEKLRKEWSHLRGDEIRKRREANESLFETVERCEVAYATDTCIDVLDQHPELYRADSLILECTFLDEKQDRDAARRKSHVHLDEIIERADRFQNKRLVLMHFSQLYAPSDVHRILRQRLPAPLLERTTAFAPPGGPWPG